MGALSSFDEKRYRHWIGHLRSLTLVRRKLAARHSRVHTSNSWTNVVTASSTLVCGLPRMRENKSCTSVDFVNEGDD